MRLNGLETRMFLSLGKPGSPRVKAVNSIFSILSATVSRYPQLDDLPGSRSKTISRKLRKTVLSNSGVE
jgi:hypothetical protein